LKKTLRDMGNIKLSMSVEVSGDNRRRSILGLFTYSCQTFNTPGYRGGKPVKSSSMGSWA